MLLDQESFYEIMPKKGQGQTASSSTTKPVVGMWDPWFETLSWCYCLCRGQMLQKRVKERQWGMLKCLIVYTHKIHQCRWGSATYSFLTIMRRDLRCWCWCWSWSFRCRRWSCRRCRWCCWRCMGEAVGGAVAWRCCWRHSWRNCRWWCWRHAWWSCRRKCWRQCWRWE